MTLGRLRFISLVLCVMASTVAAETVLYSGGDWDFENGFSFPAHNLQGAIASPCGTHTVCSQDLCDGHVDCVPIDKWAGVANGWYHHADFPTWETPGYWGVASFNENQNQDNVSRGVRSQEITLTCANGSGLIYRTATVPTGHRIRVKAGMKYTPNQDGWPDTEHDLGLDPTGNTDPNASTVQWFPWQQNMASPPQPARTFNITSETIDVFSNKLTIFIRLIAREPSCMGQTFMIDDVEVFDLGEIGPKIETDPTAITTSVRHETESAQAIFTIRNAGSGSLSYALATSVTWMTIQPRFGTSDGEAHPASATFHTAELPIGTYTGNIVITGNGAVNTPLYLPVNLTITFKPGDFDADGDVDQCDFGRFQACMTGPGASAVPPGCEEMNMDSDADIDSADFLLFQACMSGANIPSDPNCTP